MRIPVGFVFVLCAIFLNGCIAIDIQEDVILGKKNRLVVVEEDHRQCRVNGLVHRLQEDSAWCWVASTQMVIESITQAPIDSQCDFATKILETELEQKKQAHLGLVRDRPVECCQAIGKPSLTTRISTGPSPNSFTERISSEVCSRGGWPHSVFKKLKQNTGSGYTWVRKNDWGTTHSDLVWKQLNDEICQNRPIIFVVRWDELGGGGRHTSVVGGTQLLGDVKYVEVYDHYTVEEGGRDFYLMPFASFLGEPGEFIHESDYIKIQPEA